MMRNKAARRIALPLLLLLIIGAIGALYVQAPRPNTPNATIPEITTPAANVVKTVWPSWGGALNSAELDGSGFFDRAKRQQLAAAVPQKLRRFVVELNARAFFPQAGKQNLAEVLGAAQPGEQAVAYLQFFEHPTADERARLAGMGVELISYFGGYAWSARATRDAFEQALRLPNARALANIDPRDKLSETVYRAFPLRTWGEGDDKAHGAIPAYALDSEGHTRFKLLTLPGTRYEDVVEQIKERDALPGGLQLYERNASVLGPRFEVITDISLAPEIAALRSVAFVELVDPPAASRGTAGSRDATTDDTSNVTDVRDGPPNLNGASVKVAVREIGLPAQHLDYKDRLTLVDTNGSGGGEADHATAVTGQIGSSGVNNPAAKGVAPSALLFVYAVNPDTFDVTDIDNAADKSIRISNHSYGPTGLGPSDFGSYKQTSADWDDLLRRRDHIGTFSGNEETGALSKHIDYFVGAKNTICVGASGSQAHALDLSPPHPPTPGIASYSEFGPMNDGRVKPDLVAFGGDNISGSHVTLDFDTNQTQQISGTSFAAPAVSGMTALAFQHYVNVVQSEPSAALMKALLCNSATDLGALGPDQTYGFGIANVEGAVQTIDLRTSATSTPFFEGTLNNTAIAPLDIDVQVSAQLKVTLCWMDPAGNPASAKALINDLDLELEAPDGSIRFPFMLDPNNPGGAATASVPNTVDPIEQIIVDAPAVGTWKLRVKGTSIASGPQNFAVCINQPGTPPPLSFGIVASPESGPAPLPVGFAAVSGTPGVQATYTWTFGDDNSTQTGQTVQHTFTKLGASEVTLVVVAGGVTFGPYKKTIFVGKREVIAFAEKGRVRLDFSGTGKKNDLDVTMIANDPIKELGDPTATRGYIFPRTKQQAREAVRDGEFEGKTFSAVIGFSNQDGVLQGTYTLPDIILDRKASFRSTKGEVRLNLVNGQIRIRVRDPNLPGNLKIDSTTPGPLHIFAALEGSLIRYRADFLMQYSSRGSSGSGKTP